MVKICVKSDDRFSSSDDVMDPEFHDQSDDCDENDWVDVSVYVDYIYRPIPGEVVVLENLPGESHTAESDGSYSVIIWIKHAMNQAWMSAQIEEEVRAAGFCGEVEVGEYPFEELFDQVKELN